MAYKNVAARLITINTPDGKSYPIIPGETVEVESDLGVAKDFIESLVDSNQLEKVASQKQEKKEESKDAKK